MSHTSPLRPWLLALMLLGGAAQAEPLTRAQAMAALAQRQAEVRVAGLERLAEIGKMADARQVLKRLADAEPEVRSAAETAIWQIWSRSGDPVIDALFARGIDQMRASELADALATFDEIVRRKPGFAEGWNKRATVYFLLGQNAKSLKDCDEVLGRNPNHFGALSGAGQIHLKLGNTRQALDFFKRAVQVNPNLADLRQVIPILERQLKEEDRKII